MARKVIVKGNSARTRTTPTPNVEFHRNELATLLANYEEIRDCLAGEKTVKQAKTKYLPMPNSADTSAENRQRYDSYITRANFYNVTSRTLAGLVGQIFLRTPVVQVPEQLKSVVSDCTGENVPCEQLAKSTANYVLSYGRGGLMIDYPVMDAPATVAEIAAGQAKATFRLFKPWDVINWRTIKRGSEVILSLVVIEENYHAADDGFEVELATQWRVLRLVSEIENDPLSALICQVEIWQGNATSGYDMTALYQPRDADGILLNEIPFTFVGSENNNSNPDNPPLADMASLNLGHYRNSADYEEACFMVGQPTPWVAGVTKQWIDDVFKGQIQLGSRAVIPLPLNGSAGLLQADPNTMPKEAMDAKERQMVALGAKLIQQATVQRTATETDIENTAESSTLGASAKNVGAAFEFALRWAARFMIPGTPAVSDMSAPKTITYTLNTEFDLTYMNFNELLALVAAWQAGAITDEEIRDDLRRAGLASEPDETALPKMKAKLLVLAAAAKPAQIGGDPAKTAHPPNA